MKAQMKAVMASAVVIVLALAAVSGVTYSWFSDSEEVSIKVNAATYDVEQTINSAIIKTWDVSNGEVVEKEIDLTSNIQGGKIELDPQNYLLTANDKIIIEHTSIFKVTKAGMIKIDATISENCIYDVTTYEKRGDAIVENIDYSMWTLIEPDFGIEKYVTTISFSSQNQQFDTTEPITLKITSQIVQANAEIEISSDELLKMIENGQSISTPIVVDETLEIDGIKLSGANLTFNETGNAIIVSGDSTIENSKITSQGVVAVANGATLKMKDVTIINNNIDGNAVSKAAVGTSGGNVEIDGGYYQGIHSIYITQGGGNVTINSGSFKGDISISWKNDPTAQLIINGGDFEFDSISTNKPPTTGKLEINGGNFTHIGNDKPFIGSVEVKGGSFNFDPSTYVESGYTVTESGGIWTVSERT